MSVQRQMERPISSAWTGYGLGQWSPYRAGAVPAARGEPGGAPHQGQFLVVAVVAVLVLAGLSVALAGDLISPATKEVVSDVALIPLAGYVAIAAAHAARRAPIGRRRLGWWLLAAAGTLWLLGELAWYQNRYLSETVADPSWADVFYLAAVLPAAAALLAFSRASAPGERLRDLLGALIVGGSVVFVSEALTREVIFGAADAVDPLTWAVYRAYPIADIVLMILAVIVLMRVEPARRTSLALLSVGILAYMLADIWYAYSGVLDEYEPGGVWDLGWAAGYLLIGLAALAPERAPSQPAAEEPNREAPVSLSSLAVYVPVLVAVVVAAVRPFPPDRPVLVGSGVLVLVLFGVRQVLLARENVRLGRSLHGRVTELEHRTVDLRLLAEQTERVVASVVDGVLEIGSDGRIRFANPAAARLLDRPPTSLPDMPEHQLFADADASGPPSVIAQALRTGQEATSVNATFRRPDGTTFPVELALGPVLDHGRVLGIVVVFRDVTERREVERMKNEFISTVSHELRTPLTSIRGSLGLLAGGAAGALPAQAARMVTIALESTERLTRLINDLLDIERIESGTSMMDLAKCDAQSLLHTAVDEMTALARAHNVSIVVTPSQGQVLADGDRIVQTLTNLLGNAVKFSPPGSTITVSAAPADRMVQFRVRDQGRGIPAEKMSRVFERFEQVDSSDARQKGGTGLGLAISKSIIERHGGSIWVESVVDKGSTFSFVLSAFQARQAAVSAGPGQPTVLVCDDDPDVCELVGAMLRQRGYAVTTVPDARSAIARVKAEQPDVLLLDLRMPGMSGWDAVDVLHADERTRALPVVIMSGLSPQHDRRLRAQTQGWLQKPVTETAISRTLGETLRGRLRRPRVLLVEDDDALAGVLTATFERDGLRAVRAAGQQAAVALSEDLRPDAVVLDLYLADGSGRGVVETLRRSPELEAVPLVVYSGREVAPEDREALSLGRTVFLTKGRATSQQLAQHVLALLGLVSAAPAPAAARRSEAS